MSIPTAFLIVLALVLLGTAIAFCVGSMLAQRARSSKSNPEALALEKALLEIEDLRTGRIKTLATAAGAVLAAVIGWALQASLSADAITDRNNEQITETFFRYLDAIADSSSSTKRGPSRSLFKVNRASSP
jgi:hypothetical protein